MPEDVKAPEGPLSLASAAALLETQLTDDFSVPREETTTSAKVEPQARKPKAAPAPEPEEEAEAEEEAPADDDESGAPTEAEETDEGTEPEPEETTESDEEEEPLHTVKINGKEEKVTLKEALSGYQRGTDYARKTQAVAEQRKSLEAKQAEVLQQQTHYVEGLKAIEGFLQQQSPERDWDKLRVENPTKFATEWAAHQQNQQKLAAVQAERQRVMQEQAAQHQEKLEAYVKEQYATLQKQYPDWADTAKRSEHMQKLSDYAQAVVGYTPDEVKGILDARAITLLDKARLWDEHVAANKGAKAKIIKQMKVAPVLKPGSSAKAEVKKAPTVVEKAVKRFNKSGKLHDAADVLALGLDDM